MKIFNLDIQPLFYEDFFQKITKLKQQEIVFTPNPEILLEVKKDTQYRNILSQATYLTSDGIGLYIGYQIQDNSYGRSVNLVLLPYYFFNLVFRRSMLYKKYGERVCGSDITFDLVGYAEKNNIHISIVDLYNPTDIKKGESQKVFGPKLQQAFPDLKFDYHIYKTDQKEDIIEHIFHSPSQILFTTLGMKQQEQAVVDIMKQCSNIKLGLGVGSSFDYIIGFQKRAPTYMRVLGLEWFYRIFTSPGKLQRIKRVARAVFVFPLQVLFDKHI